MKLLLIGTLSLGLMFSSFHFAEAKKDVKKTTKSAKKKNQKPKHKVYMVKRKALFTLNLQQTASLQLNKRIRYINTYRRAFDLGEKFQIHLERKFKRKNVQNPGYDNEFWSLILGGDAFAADPNTCISHGHLIEMTKGNCSIREYSKRKKLNLVFKRGNREYIRCGASTGLRGEFAVIPFHDEIGRSYEPLASYGSCGGTAKALQQALLSKTDITRSSVKEPLRSKVDLINKERRKVKKFLTEYNKFLESNQGKKVTSDQLAARWNYLDDVKDLVVVPEIEAHVIKFAADHQNVNKTQHTTLNASSLQMNPNQFDELVKDQEAIERLVKAWERDQSLPSWQQLAKFGFPEWKAKEIEEKYRSLSESKNRAKYGEEVLKEFFNLTAKDGFYNNYDSISKNLDNIYGEIIDRCVARMDDPNKGIPYNALHTDLVCDEKNPRWKDCKQFTECLGTFEEEGEQLSAGRVVSIIKKYMELKYSSYTTCQSLPQVRDRDPICRLQNQPLPGPITREDLDIAEEVLNPNLEEVESFGCAKNNGAFDTNKLDIWNGYELLGRTSAACAKCSLERDAEIYEIPGSGKSNYTDRGISDKWMVLLDIIAKECNNKVSSENANLKNFLAFSQPFGHCSTETYDWDKIFPVKDDSNFRFIVFLQDNNFSDLKNPSLIKQNAEKLTQILGEKVSEENYQEILNKKFKDIFGLHFQKDVPIVTKKKAKPKNNSSALDEYSYLSSGSSSSSSDSKTNGDLKNKVNFTRKGLKDMFCPGETKERSAIQIYKDNYDRQGKARPNTYEASILDPAESSNYDGIDPSLKQCMQEGLAFAKKQDHLKLKNGEECYPPIIGQRPMKANGNYPATYDTRVPIMGTENGFYCGYSAEVKQHEGRDYIRFFHPNVRTFERNPMFDRKGVKEYSFVFIANDIRERGCNRSDCDDGYAKTYAYYQNQCSLKAIQEAEKIQKIKKSGGDSKVSN